MKTPRDLFKSQAIKIAKELNLKYVELWVDGFIDNLIKDNDLISVELIRQKLIMRKTLTRVRDTLNNVGLPQLAIKCVYSNDLSSEDYKVIEKTLEDYDNDFKDDKKWLESDLRKELVKLIEREENVK